MSRTVQQAALPQEMYNIRRNIINLAWPVMAEMFLQTFSQIVSMVLVGHLGASAVASIGLSMQPLHLAYAIFMGISVGATAVVSRMIGAGDYRRAGLAAAQAITASFVISTLGALIMLMNAQNIVVWMGAEPEVISDAARYLRVMIPGLFFMWISTTLSGALRGAGDTRTPMKANIVVNAINFAGNLLLVHGMCGFPALGTFGAGLATTIARTVGGLLLFYPYLAGKTVLKARFPDDFLPDREIMLRVSRIAIPGAFERFIMTGGQLPYVRMIAGLGTVPYAAHLIGVNAESISYMPGNGFATAATTLVGQNLGADRPDLAERSTYESFKLACAFMGSMGLVLLFFPEFLMRMYTKDADIIRLGAIYLRIMAFNQVFTAAGFVFAGALRGAGDTRFVVYLTGISVWIVRLGISYLCVYTMKTGVIGAWYGMAADWCIRGIFSWLWFRAGHWKHTTV